jgi:hypothetical protein
MPSTAHSNKTNSRNFLPLNSMLFKSTPDLRSLPTDPTLVDLRDAADTSVTALPAPQPPAKSTWQRVVAKLKEVFGAGTGEGDAKEHTGRVRRGEMQIGGPTDFKHHVTGGAQPLRTRKEEEEDEVEREWRR